jgi:hypothetical protein
MRMMIFCNSLAPRSGRFAESPKQPMIYHDGALPIFAVFHLRYVHHLVRKWLRGDVQLPNAFA